MAGIILFAEKVQNGLELISLANSIALSKSEPVLAVSLPQADMTSAYQNQGVDEILTLPALAAEQGADAYESLLIEVISSRSPGLVLLAASPLMRNLAARLAQALDTGLVSDCNSVTADSSSGNYRFERTAYGGTAIESLEIPGRVAIATVPPGMAAVAAPAERSCTVGTIAGTPSSPIRILEQKAVSGTQKNISEAPFVVCAGRGFEKAEDLDMVRTTTELLGAELACTRPLSEEMDWLPTELCIGLSGQKLKADVCLEVGISGQIQHVTGIKDCRVICSINKDENALIFKASDYGMVGDLYEILPALNDAIRALLGK